MAFCYKCSYMGCCRKKGDSLKVRQSLSGAAHRHYHKGRINSENKVWAIGFLCVTLTRNTCEMGCVILSSTGFLRPVTRVAHAVGIE